MLEEKDLSKIKFGWAVPTFCGIDDTHLDTPCYGEINYSVTAQTAILCEELGYDSLWVADHLMLGYKRAELEAWTVLTALAAVTKRIRIGTLVLCNLHRHPSLVAKMAATLDVISDGRLEYGVGAGWHKWELQAYGLPWIESAVKRIEMMEEGIEIVKKLWTEDIASFKGKYYEIKEAICEPKPLQKPHPPIWIGGAGKRVILAAAKYADAWNWYTPSIQEYEEMIETLRRHCNSVGRKFSDITLSWDGHILIAENDQKVKNLITHVQKFSPKYPIYIDQMIKPEIKYEEHVQAELSVKDYRAHNLVGTPEKVIDRIQQYVDLGASHFMLWFIDFPSPEGIKLFAEKVMPAFK